MVDNCVICLEPLGAATATTRTLRCGHVFHRPCIDNALAVTAATCPLCRSVVPGAPAPVAARPRVVGGGRTTLAVNRHQLLQRLDRIDRLISVIAGHVQRTSELLEGERLVGTVREIRAMLRPSGVAVAAGQAAVPATTRRLLETPPRRRRDVRSTRVAATTRTSSNTPGRAGRNPAERAPVPAAPTVPPRQQRVLAPAVAPPHRESGRA